MGVLFFLMTTSCPPRQLIQEAAVPSVRPLQQAFAWLRTKKPGPWMTRFLGSELVTGKALAELYATGVKLMLYCTEHRGLKSTHAGLQQWAWFCGVTFNAAQVSLEGPCDGVTIVDCFV